MCGACAHHVVVARVERGAHRAEEPRIVPSPANTVISGGGVSSGVKYVQTEMSRSCIRGRQCSLYCPFGLAEHDDQVQDPSLSPTGNASPTAMDAVAFNSGSIAVAISSADMPPVSIRSTDGPPTSSTRRRTSSNNVR